MRSIIEQIRRRFRKKHKHDDWDASADHPVHEEHAEQKPVKK